MTKVALFWDTIGPRDEPDYVEVKSLDEFLDALRSAWADPRTPAPDLERPNFALELREDDVLWVTIAPSDVLTLDNLRQLDQRRREI